MNTQFDDHLSFLDKYLSPAVRCHIEEAFYQKINAGARLAEVIKDPLFLSHPLRHASLSGDHGVVHIRDVACRLLVLLDQLNGVHFPQRSSAHLTFMKGYGAMLAYVHDVGMLQVKFSEYDLPAQAATQLIFNDFFDQQLSLLWEENSGNVAWRITQLAYKKALTQPPKQILREILALCGAYDKTAVAIGLFDHPAELRRVIQEMTGYSLHYQALQSALITAEHQQHAAAHLDARQQEKYKTQKAAAEAAFAQADPTLNRFLNIYYHDFWQESFQWLISENEEAAAFIKDVLDTLRTLRAAHASRQRGAKLRTAGEHQIFLDHHSANAIYAINADHKVFLLENKNTLLAGEVNLSSTEFTQAGDLRISFYCGQFADKAATDRAVFNAASAIQEVQAEMLGSFIRKTPSQAYLKKGNPAYILLENCHDNTDFSLRVKAQLILNNPELKNAIRIVPCLQNASEPERNRYLNAEDLQWNLKTEKDILDNIAQSGHKIAGMNVQEAFQDVKSADIAAGEVLMQAGTLASFVYVPLSEGLTGYPLGGYTPFHAAPFVPLGNVSVIRGDVRNATLVAEMPLKVLIIPGEVYLKCWHTVYTEQEFIALLKAVQPLKGEEKHDEHDEAV